jgi:hypothetical protein
MSITQARNSHWLPTGMYVMSPHHRSSSREAVNSRSSRSGTGGATRSGTVVRFFRRGCRPTTPFSRIRRATRLRFTW